MNGILIATLVVGGVGIFIGLFLGIAAIVFKVEIDEKEVAVLEALPGNNCGGCGYAGCSGLAAAIAKGEAAVNQCPVGGEAVAKKISEIMGIDAEAAVKKVAYVACNGTCEHAKVDYEYYGVEDALANQPQSRVDVEDPDTVAAFTRELSYNFTQDEAYIQKEIEQHLHRTILLRLTPEHICGKRVNES